MSDSPLYISALEGNARNAWQSFFQLYASKKAGVFTCQISSTELYSANVENVTNLVSSLQHFPKYIGEFIGALRIQFSAEKSIDSPCANQLAINDDMIKWFSELNTLPATLFFMEDFDHQFLMIAGDQVMNGNLKPISVMEDAGASSANSGSELLIDHWAATLLTERLVTAARSFQLFCYQTGYDPETRVNEVFGNFPVKIDYSDVRKYLLDDLKVNKNHNRGSYIID